MTIHETEVGPAPIECHFEWRGYTVRVHRESSISGELQIEAEIVDYDEATNRYACIPHDVQETFYNVQDDLKTSRWPTTNANLRAYAQELYTNLHLKEK